MSNAAELLARATAKGGQYEELTSGGLSRFSSAQIGHALAGIRRRDDHFESLPDGAFRVLLLRYADGKQQDEEELIKDLLDEAGKERDWVTQVAHAAICRQAYREFMDSRACAVCEGRGAVKPADLVEDCIPCRGTGRKQRTTAGRARACGLPFETFRRAPAENYYLGRLYCLYQWEEQGLRRVAGKATNSDEEVVQDHHRRVLRMYKNGQPGRWLWRTIAAIKALPIVGEHVSSAPVDAALFRIVPKTTEAALMRAIDKLFDTYPET